MARKTIKKPNKRLGQTRRRRVRKNTSASASASAPAPAPAPAVSESQRFVSSITFDGNTLVTKTQKNNEPVNEEIYTMDQLAQDLPIGKRLIDIHLDGEMPRQLQQHHRKRMKPMFNNVLLHPADLGLLAPNVEVSAPADKRRSLRRRRRRHSARHSRDDHMRLMVSDANPAADDADAGVQYKRPRNLFDLP
jgi:hypothetical protein